MKAAVLDIETATLSTVGPGAAFYCAVFKPLDSKKSIVYDHRTLTERGAVRATIDLLSEYDLIIGHNVKNFDLKMLFSFAGKFGLKWNCNPLIYDTYPAFRRIGYCTTLTQNGKRRASLAFAIDYFWPDENDKTSLYPNWHARAFEKGEAGGHALQDVISHCVCDVLMNERLYWRILPDDDKPVIKRFRQ